MMNRIREKDKLHASILNSMPRHFSAAANKDDTTAIGNNWRINVSGNEDRALCGAESLAKFLGKYCGLELPVVIGESYAPFEIRLGWSGDAGEGYRIRTEVDSVEINGESPAGTLYGAHRLQWMMGENGGPFVPLGEVGICPKAPIRITSTSFHQPFDDAGDPLTYTDEYLDLMAHYGFNGLHMYVDIYDYMDNVPEAPELADSAAGERIARLAQLSERASRYNVGIYLHVNTTRRSKDHPVFDAHPELLGATSWEEGYCCLCSSEPRVARIYGNALANIIDKVPGVKGVIAIVGGECILHCYTRPYPRTKKGTNCPNCAGREAEEVVAGLINSMAEHVWASHPAVHFVVWPYSAHLWSKSPDQRELMRLLDKRIGFTTCYDKDAWVEFDGAKTTVFDYSISYIGPSEPYRNQRQLAAAQDRSFGIKTESSVTIEMMNVPYIPVLESWKKRWQGMMSDNLTSVIANWRFAGLTGTLSEELAYREIWKNGEDEDTLRKMAARLAGADGAADCLNAWHLFSEAFSRLAFCPGLSGFPYFRGPMFLGPAHPLILHSDEGSSLPSRFFQFDPCLLELENTAVGDEILAAIPRLPLYFDDYRWTLPLGKERMRCSLEDVCKLWGEGLESYQQAYERVNPALRATLQSEIDIALMSNTVLRSTLNLSRFQAERDVVLIGPIDAEESEASYHRLLKIVEDDLTNSAVGLELARRDFRFGYGFTYGDAFDADMIQAKIDFTKQVLLPDIEKFYDILISHAFARSFVARERGTL